MRSPVDILESLSSTNPDEVESALEELEELELARESPYAASIAKKVYELAGRKLVETGSLGDNGPFAWAWSALQTAVMGAAKWVSESEIVFCSQQIFQWPDDHTRTAAFYYLMNSAALPDELVQEMVSHLVSIFKQDPSNNDIRMVTVMCRPFHAQITDQQVDDILGYLLVPTAMDRQPGETVESIYTPAYLRIEGVLALKSRLTSVHWLQIRDCLGKLNHTPVEAVQLVYEEQPKNGLDAQALLLECIEVVHDETVARKFVLSALTVLLRNQPAVLDPKLLSQLSTLASDMVVSPGIRNTISFGGAEAALFLYEVMKLQTLEPRRTQLLSSLFKALDSAEYELAPGYYDYSNIDGIFQVLALTPDWTRTLPITFREPLIAAALRSSTEHSLSVMERLCEHYAEPPAEFLDTFSRIADELYDRLIDADEVLEKLVQIITRTKAFEPLLSDPGCEFWARVRRNLD